MPCPEGGILSEDVFSRRNVSCFLLRFGDMYCVTTDTGVWIGPMALHNLP